MIKANVTVVRLNNITSITDIGSLKKTFSLETVVNINTPVQKLMQYIHENNSRIFFVKIFLYLSSIEKIRVLISSTSKEDVSAHASAYALDRHINMFR